MTTITFRVTPAPEGGYVAQAIGHSIVTQGETEIELAENAQEAARVHLGEPVEVVLESGEGTP